MTNMKDYKLFTIGPAQMYPNTIEVRSHMVPYFRTAEFSDMMLENAELLKKFENAEPEAEVIVLTASGSGAMEAAVQNCFNEDDHLLVVCGGTFGERFVRICEIHQIRHDVIYLNTEETLSPGHFKAFENKGITGVLVNINETYTGQLYDIGMIHDYCQRTGAYLIVDAISSFLCDPYDAKKNSVDVTIVSSQKGLCIAPGLSFVTLSERMAEKVRRNHVKSLYFDFKEYMSDMKRGQTPFTPAVGVCFELNDMLRKIDSQGLEGRIAEVKKRAVYFRKKIENFPISLPPFPLSNSITPIRFEKEIAGEIFTYLKDQKGMMVNPVGGELGKRSIRIAHIGDLDLSDYDRLVEEMRRFFHI